MAASSSNFIMPTTAVALVNCQYSGVSNLLMVVCRLHPSQSSHNKEKKDITFCQVYGHSGRPCVMGQHRRREVTSGAMLFDSNVETGSDDAEAVTSTAHGFDTINHAGEQFLERGLLSNQNLTYDGNECVGREVESIVGEATELNLMPRNGGSSHPASGNTVEVFDSTRDSWKPFRNRFWKGNMQCQQSLTMDCERERHKEISEPHIDSICDENPYPDQSRIAPTDEISLQEAKAKELAGCLLAMKRLRLACARAVSRTLRNVKGAMKDGMKATDGNIITDEIDPDASVPRGGNPVEKAEEPSGSTRDEELDEIPWDVLSRLWDNPAFVKFRVSVSMANLTMALPTFLSRALPLLSSFPLKGFSFPVLAPLLFGGGIVFKSAVSNLGFVLPRMLVSMAIMWVLWALNHVIQEAIQHLKDTGSVDRRLASVLVLFVELTFSAIAVVTVLSSIGLNVNSLLLPSFLALALAGKDVWQNYFAGFFLFAAQPFRPGHTVAIQCCEGTTGSQPAFPLINLPQVKSGWFEGLCEAVDLRYTVLRNGKYRLMVPNAIFVKREFMIIDPEPEPTREPSKKYQGPRSRIKQRQSKGEINRSSHSPPTMAPQKVQELSAGSTVETIAHSNTADPPNRSLISSVNTIADLSNTNFSLWPEAEC